MAEMNGATGEQGISCRTTDDDSLGTTAAPEGIGRGLSGIVQIDFVRVVLTADPGSSKLAGRAAENRSDSGRNRADAPITHVANCMNASLTFCPVFALVSIYGISYA